MKYIFTSKPEFEEPIRVLFLCGTKYSKNEDDKRVVLKSFLEQDSKNKVVILEDYYDFSNKNNELLSYYSANLFDLYHIEMLASIFSTKTFIIHDSFSTAGEICTFASNPNLRDKIVTIVPERYSVEEEKLSSFISLAFWNRKNKLISNDILRYYPVTKNIKISDYRSIYHTFFKNNVVPNTLQKEINNILNITNDITKVCIYNSSLLSNNVKHNERTTTVHISFESFKNYMFSIFTVDEIRRKLHSCKKIYEIKNLFKNFFEETLQNTILHHDGKCKTLKVILGYQIDLNLDDAISMMIFIMNSCGIIRIKKGNEDNNISVSICKNSVATTEVYSELLITYDNKEWGE